MDNKDLAVQEQNKEVEGQAKANAEQVPDLPPATAIPSNKNNKKDTKSGEKAATEKKPQSSKARTAEKVIQERNKLAEAAKSVGGNVIQGKEESKESSKLTNAAKQAASQLIPEEDAPKPRGRRVESLTIAQQEKVSEILDAGGSKSDMIRKMLTQTDLTKGQIAQALPNTRYQMVYQIEQKMKEKEEKEKLKQQQAAEQPATTDVAAEEAPKAPESTPKQEEPTVTAPPEAIKESVEKIQQNLLRGNSR